MIALCSYSTNSLVSDSIAHSSTGELVKRDSVLISYDDLRTVNSKLVELEYDKTIISQYEQLHTLDSIRINTLDRLATDYNKKAKKYNTQRIIFGGVGLCTLVSTIILLIK